MRRGGGEEGEHARSADSYEIAACTTVLTRGLLDRPCRDLRERVRDRASPGYVSSATR